jgi:SWI/SNF-related matrix-associated actin-dependent regulator 1 of chromatin subfamily A
MQIEYLGGIYLAHDAPDAAVMQAAGWRWNKLRHAWFTSDQLKAMVLRQHAIGPAKERLEALAARRAAAIADSHAVDADIDIPAPEGLAYRPYQLAGIRFMLGRVSSLNADVPRLGKTIQSVGVMNATPDLKRALIVPPAGVKINWTREFNKWNTHAGLEAAFCEGKSNPKSPVLVCNYDILHHHRDYIAETDWDVAVFDEAHYLKNRKAYRTELCIGGNRNKPIIRAKRRLFLTGTPIFTRPVDIFTLCEECDKTGLGKSWWNFVHRYCNAHNTGFGLDTSGASNLEELQFNMRSRFLIRREKKDIGKELPPNRQTIIFPKTGLAPLVKKEQNFVRKNLERFEQMLQARLEDEDVDHLLAEYGHLDGVDRTEATGVLTDYDNAFEALATIRQDLALAKLPMVGKFVEEMLWSEPKVVVFAHHRSVTGKLKEMFPDAAMIIGGMSPTKRQEQIDRFQTDPSCRVFIGNIVAAGQGIPLSAADVVVFAEMSWVPSEMEQAEERVWDVMKENAVSSYWLVVEDSLDAQMAAILERRMKDIKKALAVASLGVH